MNHRIDLHPIGAKLAALMAPVAMGLLLGTVASASQPSLPAAELREDLELLRSALTEAHAGIFIYESPQALARTFDSTLAAIHDTTAAGFYGVVARVLAPIRDGHTRSLPSEQWMTWYADSARVFPWRVKFADGRGWVTASGDPRIGRGAEILSINGRAVGQIAADIRSRLPADGFIETGTLAGLNERFEFWNYVFESQADSFRIEIRARGGGRTSIRVAAIPPSALPSDTTHQHPPLERPRSTAPSREVSVGRASSGKRRVEPTRGTPAARS